MTQLSALRPKIGSLLLQRASVVAAVDASGVWRSCPCMSEDGRGCATTETMPLTIENSDGRVLISLALPSVEVLLVQLLLLVVVYLLHKGVSVLQEGLEVLKRLSENLPKPALGGPAPSGAPSPAGAREAPRLLHTSTLQFEACMIEQHGEPDVDLAAFISACRAFCPVVQTIGPFTLISIREVHSNMHKVTPNHPHD